MIRDLSDDYAVLQTGYWRVEIDTAHPRFVSMRADAEGLGDYCQEMLEPGHGGESVSGYNDGLSIGHKDGYLNAVVHFPTFFQNVSDLQARMPTPGLTVKEPPERGQSHIKLTVGLSCGLCIRVS